MKRKFSFAMVLLLVFNLILPTGLISTVSAAEEGAAPDIPVLLYHKIVENPTSTWNDTDVEKFKNTMRYLHDNGYKTLSAEEYVAIMDGTEPVPDKPILLTFDDATSDFITNALPILKEYNMHSVLFVISDWIDGGYSMSKEELVSLVDEENVSLQNHTKNHSDVTWGNGVGSNSTITNEQASDSIAATNTYLKVITDKDPVLMAYPYGSYNDAAKQANLDNEIKYAFKVGYPNDGDYAMGRHYVRMETTLTEIASMIGGPAPDVEPTPEPVTETVKYDFEAGETQGWTVRGSGNVTSVNEAAHSGEYSLKSTGRTATWNGPSVDLLSTLEKGATYEITGYVKLANPVADTPSSVSLTMLNHTVGADDDGYATVNNQSISTGDWIEFTGDYTFTEDKDTLILYVESDKANEEFYVDDVTITMTSPAAGDGEGEEEPPVEIPDGEAVAAFTDFEDGTEQGWVARSGNEELSATDVTAKNGDFSLFVDNRQASTDAALIEFLDNMHLGNEYKFSLWVKLGPGEEDTELQLSAAQTVDGETSYYPPVIEPTMVTSDDWVLLEGTYSVPTNVEALSFYVEEVYDEEQTTGVSYYIDDFKAEVFVPDYGIEDITPLKEIYDDEFLIGNAVGSNHFAGRDLELLTKHHNLVTAENVMKPESYYNDAGEFTHSSQDTFLQNAIDNNLKIHGHVLMWHSQSEDSLYQNADGSYKTREEALANMDTHIENVMTSAHDVAGDSLISWDVVNEALDGSFANPEDWKANLRTSSGWLQSIGDDYLYEAYLKARQVADDLGQHDMVLYYNDYNDHIQSKATTMYHMIKDINERYAAEYPDDDRKLISGVGMQAHYTTSVNVENVRTSLERFIELGIEVGITELDVGASETTTLTEEEELEQAYFYAQLFDLYKEHASNISRVTLWGLSDGYSWRSENNPLLFDNNLQAKEAYYAIVDPETYLIENEPVEVVARAGNAAYGTPNIDAEIDEIWNLAPVLPIDRFQSAHNGATGEARVLWDNENVYVLVEVSNAVLDKSSVNPWEQDSVEVFIDEQNTKAASFGEGHGQYRVNFDNEQSFNPGEISEGFESKTMVNGTNYLVEMKIPIKTTEVEDGHTIGFDVQINDALDGARNSAAIWNDYTGMGWSDPSIFGNLKLVATDEQIVIQELQAQIDALKQKINELDEENVTQLQLIEALEGQVVILEGLLADLGSQIVDQGSSLQDLQDQITELNNMITDLLERISELEESQDDEKDKDPVKDKENSKPVVVKPIVKDNKATVTDKEVKKVNKNGQFVVDLSDNSTSLAISFTKEQIKELKKQDATITIKKKDVEVVIPSSILGDENFNFEFTKLKDIDGALSAVYDFKIVQDGKEISAFSDKVILTFAVDASLVENPENVKVFYWNPETKEWELVGGEYKDGTISVEVDHFSTFTVFETSGNDLPKTEDPAVEDGNELPKTEDKAVEDGEELPDTATNTFNWLVLGLIMVLAGFAFFLIRKRKRA